MPTHSARLAPSRGGMTIAGPDEEPGTGGGPPAGGAVAVVPVPPNATANDRRSSSTSEDVHGSSRSARPPSGYARFSSLLVFNPSTRSATLFIVDASSSNPPCVVEREAWSPSLPTEGEKTTSAVADAGPPRPRNLATSRSRRIDSSSPRISASLSFSSECLIRYSSDLR